MHQLIQNCLSLIILSVLLQVGDGMNAQAKVYRRWSGHAGAHAIFSGEQPGQSLYESRARMNGADGTAKVERYETDFELLRTALRESPPPSSDASATRWRIGQRHILGTPLDAVSGQRTLFIDLPDQNAVLCIRFTPSGARRRSTDAVTAPSGMPVYPGATIEWSLELDQSGMAVYSATATAHPSMIAEHLNRDLTRAGWQPALEPPKGHPKRPTLGGVYIRGNALLAVQTSASRQPGEPARVTIVHKQR